jgi:hypothetical protein
MRNWLGNQFWPNSRGFDKEKSYGDIEDIPQMDLPKPSIRSLRMMRDDSLI